MTENERERLPYEVWGLLDFMDHYFKDMDSAQVRALRRLLAEEILAELHAERRTSETETVVIRNGSNPK